jgi:deaminated glutathione amidase
VSAIRDLATSTETAILVGGIWLSSDDPDRPHNACQLIDETGQVTARYRKIHLFRLNDPLVEQDESRMITPGNDLVLVHWRGCNLGLSVCYDLRFPEMYSALARAGADALCVPANFSAWTGPVHWQQLLPTRAIENLCYVLAPAQSGIGGAGFAAHGHSLAVDPWGVVRSAAEPPQAEGLMVAEISHDLLAARRAALASSRESRPDIHRRRVTTSIATVS